MADNQYGYSTGYPGFAGQPAAAPAANQFVNYPQWNTQANYPNAANPYSQPPPNAPQGAYQAYNQPPPAFPQSQPPPQVPASFGGNNQYGNTKDMNQYNRSGGGGYNNRGGYDHDLGDDRASGGRSGGGNYNSGANRGGYDKGPVDTRTGDLVVQQDTIFISGMQPSTTESQIVTHFGAIGIIKTDKKTNKPKIWMYTDKQTGRPKGEATVTFEDPFTASSAIEWFDGKEFNGSTIAVQLASRRDNWQGGRGGRGGRGGGGGGGRGNRGGGPPREDRDYDDSRGGGGGYGRDDEDNGYGRDRDFGRGGFRGRGGSDRSGGGFKGGDRDGRGGRGDRQGGGGRSGGPGGGGYGGREGDWKCPNSECGNTNFSWRQQCNRCNEDKPADAGSGGDSDKRAGGGRGGRGGFGGGFGGGGGRGRGGGSRGGGGPVRNDYSNNNRNRPY